MLPYLIGARYYIPTHKDIIKFQFLFASNPCRPDLQPAGLAPNHPIVYNRYP
jgi:hypothetical protein